jgi:cell division protease FtsH
MYLPEGDKYSTQQKEALDLLAVMMGGRIAEEMFTNDVSNGAAGDIKQATQLTRRMVCEWGMSSLGMISFSESNDFVFLARDMGHAREYSEATAQQIDAEVKRIIDEAYHRATVILEANRAKVETIAKALLEYETLDASHVKEIIEFGKIQNPPKIEALPPPLPPAPTDSIPEPKEPIKPEFPSGGLAAPAPA